MHGKVEWVMPDMTGAYYLHYICGMIDARKATRKKFGHFGDKILAKRQLKNSGNLRDSN